MDLYGSECSDQRSQIVAEADAWDRVGNCIDRQNKVSQDSVDNRLSPSRWFQGACAA